MKKRSPANKISEARKRREAARKAWQTIRKRRRKEATQSSGTLSETGFFKVSEPKLASVRTGYGKYIIHQFNKTPSTIACGPFWELRWAFGCPLNCDYCYLRGTSRGNMKPRYVKIDHVLQALDQVFADESFNEGKPAIFNSGELADSWMNPSNMIQIVDKFEEQRKHRLLMLTKLGSNNEMVRLLSEKLRSQTIAAFSINAERVAQTYERLAAAPSSRIEAASRLSKTGYDIRIRIDPIFPITDWQKHYEDVIYSIFAEFEPNRVILGTPRGLRKTIFFARKAGVDLSWIDFLEKKETGWGWKLPFETRFEIYQFMYEKLLALGFDKNKISMCKETLQMWERMGLNYTPFTCNCYGRG